MDYFRKVANKYLTLHVDPPEQTPTKGRVLVIHGHPSGDHSFSAEITKTAVEELLKNGHQVKIFNPCDGSFNPLLSEAEHRHRYDLNVKRSEALESHIETLKWADRILFIYPTWWSLPPAGIKGYIDRVFVAHVAYKPPPGEIPPQEASSTEKSSVMSPLFWRKSVIMPNLEIKKIGVITTFGGPRMQTWITGDLGARFFFRVLPASCFKSAPEKLYLRLFAVYESEKERVNFLHHVAQKIKYF